MPKNSKFYDLYKKYKEEMSSSDLIDKMENASDIDEYLYDDNGRPIEVRESRIMNLDYHVVKIEQLGAKITISSLVDPNITGTVQYEEDDKATKAYKSLGTARNVISFIRHHSKEEVEAYDLSQIIFDETLAIMKNKREEAKAMGAETDDMFNDGGDGDGGEGGFGGGGGGDAPETMGGPGEDSGGGGGMPDDTGGDEPPTEPEDNSGAGGALGGSE